MNIVASNATTSPEPGRTDGAPATGIAVGFDAASGDGSVASGADVQDFGQLLSDSLAKGRVPGQDSAARSSAGDGVPHIASDPSSLVGKRSAADLHAVADPWATAPKKDVADETKSSPSTDAAVRPDDAISTDLSSQIALVSQWAGLAPTPVSTDAPTPDDPPPAGAAATTTGRSIGATVNGVRTTADTTAVVAATIDPAQLPAATDTAASETAAFAVASLPRATGSSNAGIGAIPKSTTARPVDTTTPLASPDGSGAIDKLFALVGGTAPHTTATDPSSIAGQFVAQVSAQVSNAQASTGLAAAPAAPTLREPVGTSAWSHELGQTAIRMATNDLQTASLRLNPEHLGPLDVQMRIDNGVAHMQFTAAHAETRHALESSRTTLDHMFGEQGLKLGDWSVGNSASNGSFARNLANGSTPRDDARVSGADVDAHADDLIPATVAMRPLGLVDTFA